MTTEVTASLGFSVDTGALDKGKQSLDQFADSTKKVKQSADELNSAGQTAGAATENLGNKATATGKSFSLFGNAINEVKSFLGFHTAGATSAAGASEALGTSIGHANTATRGFRDSLHVLNPLVYSLGGNLSGMGTFAGAARAGIEGLAAAITISLLVSLEKAYDKIEKVRTVLALYLGGNGKKAFDDVRQSADAAQVPIDNALKGIIAFQQALGQTSHFITLTGEKDPITGQWLTSAGLYEDHLKDVVSQFTIIGTKAHETSTASGQIFSKFLEDAANAKALTADVFHNLRAAGDAGEAQAQAIAAAYSKAGQRGTDQFEQELRTQAKSLDDLKSHMQSYAEEVKKINAVQPDLIAPPPNVLQSWDHLTTAVGKAWAEFGKGHSIFADLFEGWSKGWDQLASDLHSGMSLWDIFWKDISTSPKEEFANLGKALSGLWNTIVAEISAQNQDIANKIKAIWDALPSAAQSVLSSIAGIATSIINSVASAIESIVSKVLAAIAQMRQEGAQSSYNAASQNTMGYSSASGPSFIVDPNGNAVQNYATGGDFTVKQSQRVMFHASPDEIVTVEPPGKKAAVFLVGGSGGTDSQRVQFPAVAGTHVTITPPGKSLPNTVFGTSGILADGSVTSAGVKQATSAAISSISGINTGGASSTSAAGPYGTVTGMSYTGMRGYGGAWGAPVQVSSYASSGGIFSAYNPLGAPIYNGGFTLKDDPSGWGFGTPGTGGTWNTVWNSGGGGANNSNPPPVVTVGGGPTPINTSASGPSWMGANGGSTWALSNDPSSPNYYGSLANDYGYFAQGGGFTVGGGSSYGSANDNGSSPYARHIGGDDHVEFRVKMTDMAGGYRRPSFVASRSQIMRSMVGR